MEVSKKNQVDISGFRYYKNKTMKIHMNDTAFEKYRKRDVNKPYQEPNHTYHLLFFRC